MPSRRPNRGASTRNAPPVCWYQKICMDRYIAAERIGCCMMLSGAGTAEEMAAQAVRNIQKFLLSKEAVCVS